MRIEVNECICILTAGKGSRLRDYTEKLNKALIPLNKKAAISHIIDKFDIKDEFIIALGHKGSQVKNFLKIQYPKHNFKFVKIKNYDKKGSGPGLSLKLCKKHLKKPFYFLSCDTLWNNTKILKNQKKNWMAVGKKKYDDFGSFCNLVHKKNIIYDLFDKKIPKTNHYQFSGLAYVYDWKIFWKHYSSKLAENEVQVSSGFYNLIKNTKVELFKIDWIDIGTEQNYQSAIKLFEKYNFSKKSEFLYINKKQIIKIYSDKRKLRNIFQRSKIIKKFVSPNIKIKDQLLIQKFVDGDVLYNKLNISIFKNLMKFLFNKFWMKNDKVDLSDDIKFFYKKKTLSRLDDYLTKYRFFEHDFINGKKLLKIKNYIKKINWDIFMKEYKGSRFHGDLQFDNIIFNSKNSKFTLIDWRDKFGNNLEFGDLYYDIAKLYGGMIIDYTKIKQNKFTFLDYGKKVRFKMISIKNFEVYEKLFKNILFENNIDFKRVEILTALIFLNMSPLHYYPFDIMLFNRSKIMLDKYFRNTI